MLSKKFILWTKIIVAKNFAGDIYFIMSKDHKNLELSKILDLEKIRVVGNPIEKANGLPNV